MLLFHVSPRIYNFSYPSIETVAVFPEPIFNSTVSDPLESIPAMDTLPPFVPVSTCNFEAPIGIPSMNCAHPSPYIYIDKSLRLFRDSSHPWL